MTDQLSNTTFASRPRVLLGRDALLSLLERRLAEERRCVIGSDPGITDPSGVGRTCLAEALIHRVVQAPMKLLRLRAATQADWHWSVWKLSRELGLPETQTRKHTDRVTAIRHWLLEHSEWLLYVDSLVDWDGLLELIQSVPHGRYVVTKRDHSTVVPPHWPAAVPLGGLAPEDALRLLQEALGRDWRNVQEQQAARQIVDALERIPRSMTIAGATIRLGLLDCETYWQQYRGLSKSTPISKSLRLLLAVLESQPESPLPLLSAALALDGEAIPGAWLRDTSGQRTPPSAPHSAWSLLIQAGLFVYDPERDVVSVSSREDLRDLLSVELLMTGATLASLVLPARSIRRRLHEFVCGATIAPVDEWTNQRIALGHSVLRFSRVGTAEIESLRQAADVAIDLQLEPQAHQFLLKVLDQQIQAASREEAVRDALVELGAAYIAGEQFQHARRRLRQAIEFCPSDEPLWTEMQLAVVEIDVNENRIERANLRLTPLDFAVRDAGSAIGALLLSKLRFLQGGIALAEQNPELARQRFQAALDGRAGRLPVEHPDMMKTRLMLARAEFMLKNHAASEAILRAEVDIRESSPYVSLHDTGIALNFLGELYYLLGRLQDAELIYDKSLSIRRRMLPHGHRLIGEMANRLAVIKSSRGAYREADILFRESLSTLEEVYGSDHPEVARTLTDLAESLFSQHKVEPARRLLERALGMQERALRSNDPRLGRTRCNLAAVYVARGRFPDAVRLYEKDVAERAKAKRSDPSALATSLNNLAEALRALGRYAEAEQRLQSALELRESTVGSHHPQTAQILGNLGYLNFQLHRYDAARNYLERTILIREAALGPHNPQLATTLVTLGEVLFAEGRYADARPLFQQGSHIFQAAYGDRHPHLVSAQISAARNEMRLGHMGRGELMLLRAKTLLEELLGPDHRLAAKSLLAMAELAHCEKRYADAFPLLERCLAIQYSTTSSVRLEIAETLAAIAENLVARQLHREALPRIIEAVEIQRQILGTEHPEIVPNQLLIASIQQSIGNLPEAEEALVAVLDGAALHVTPAQLAIALEQLIDVQIVQQKYDAAVGHLKTRLAEVITTGDGAAELAVISQLASVHYLRSAPEEALPLIERCVALSEQIYGPQHIETAKHLDNLAGVHFLISNHAASEQAVQRAISILEQQPSPVSAKPLAKARSNYIQLLRQSNRLEEADRIEQQVQATVVESSEEISASHVLDDLF